MIPTLALGLLKAEFALAFVAGVHLAELSGMQSTLLAAALAVINFFGFAIWFPNRAQHFVELVATVWRRK